MADLTVTPGHLEALAQRHNEAAEGAEQAAVATTHIGTQVKKSWGPLFQDVNDKFTEAEKDRRDAVRRIKDRCINLSAKLNSSAQAYVNSDALSGESLDKQVLTY